MEKEMTKKILILGSALRGGALLILDAMRRSSKSKFTPIGILDDTPNCIGTKVLGVEILGGIEKIDRLWMEEAFDEAIIAIGSVEGRKKIFDIIANKEIPLANIIDESVHLGDGVEMGQGNVMLPGCHFGPLIRIGDNNFFGTRTLIEHESIIGDTCSFGVGCTIAGRVKIGSEVYFGTASGARADVEVKSNTSIAPGVIL